MTDTIIPAAAKIVDHRVQRSRETVLAATGALLFERGYSGASVDEISRRSGVAKTTIYRHWSTRTDLLRDACSTIGTLLKEPDTGSLESDLITLMAELGEVLTSARWSAVLPSIIDAAERDPDIADMYSKLQQGYSAPLATVLHRAVKTGELSEQTDVAMLIAALTGPFFYRRWFSREPLTEAFAKQIIQQVMR
ncbi:TetR/AcrR family transcriptional regulator [Mesorhizobium sp. M7A.F.Ca.US.006.01.1.1]|uniref:TetR/AcrR family transcriptional regulator n=1 Tax=Mesorhizobium sp. M7A.F.Ca.US.006.01.1.1 TaxID=2496707 RepID=UPI000FCA4822|nr:TetR/AcrR family transcriptional regulator [Mesorhizobium sp. M7A.F.Ca.US.006.01.1.1]RUZ77855.1 TetR/AcrR family transcriptional regulator [Mesorhizobium sp. M7A.F.Ca.US.006.01.1.1]